MPVPTATGGPNTTLKRVVDVANNNQSGAIEISGALFAVVESSITYLKQRPEV